MRAAAPQSGRWPGVALVTWLQFWHTRVTLSTPCDRPEEEYPITSHPSAVRIYHLRSRGICFILTVARSLIASDFDSLDRCKNFYRE